VTPPSPAPPLRLFEPGPEVSPSSEWCQRWTGGRHSWRRRYEGGFDPARYTVEPLDERRTKAYVTANHYLSGYPGTKFRYGLFEGGTLVGACILGLPMNQAVLTNPYPDLVPLEESIELSRLVLADRVPANGESFFVSAAFADAAAAGVRGVVAFSDPVPRVVEGRTVFPGHVGVIYQALNGVYTGRSASRTKALLPNGAVLTERAMSKVQRQDRGHAYVERSLVALGARPPRACSSDPAGWLRQALEDVGARPFRHRGVHRYLFAIGPGRRRRTAALARASLPYPKTPDS
jgi:hypothetical protein